MNRDLLEAVNPPRKNGELVFAAPWEGLSFGLALALHERGLFPWEEFRQRLIAATRAHPEANYYERWLTALAGLLTEKGILRPEEVAARVEEFRSGRREVTY